MRFASALAADQAASESVPALVDSLAGEGLQSPDLALLFTATTSGSEAEAQIAALESTLAPAHSIACSAEWVIGNEREVEEQPAATLLAGWGEGMACSTFELGDTDWKTIFGAPEGLRDHLELDFEPKLFVLLAEPFTAPLRHLLPAFDSAFPAAPVVGGVASGGMSPGMTRLSANGRIRDEGVVGLALGGAVEPEIILSQGCRPIGSEFEVTGAERSQITELDGRKPTLAFRELYHELDSDLQSYIRSGGLLIGIAVDDSDDPPGPSDYLIRNVSGVNPETGAIGVMDLVRSGQVVRFHVRTPAAAADDLELLLSPQAFATAPAAALLFTCNARGTRLYAEPNRDVGIVGRAIGRQVPVAGFFANGELGPVGASNYVHSYSASICLLRPAGDREAWPA